MAYLHMPLVTFIDSGCECLSCMCPLLGGGGRRCASFPVGDVVLGAVRCLQP